MARAWAGQLQGYAPRTVRLYGQLAELLARDVAQLDLDPNIRRWREEQVLTVRDYLVETNGSSQLHGKMKVLQHILTYAGNPVMHQMKQRRTLRLPPRERGRVRWHTPEERDTMLAASSGTTRMILWLGYGLGLRRTEMADLELRDLRGTTARVIGKGGRHRELPITGQLDLELRSYLGYRQQILQGAPKPHPETVLVHTHYGTASGFRPTSIWQRVKDHGAMLGIPATTHDLRRTFGRSLWERGVDLIVIKELLGHTTVEMTIQYLGLDLDDMRTALDTLYGTMTCTERDIASRPR